MKRLAARAMDQLGFGDSRNAGSAISRMPRRTRDAVSTAIQDGADWRRVAKICDKAGFPGVRAQNVTNYKKNSHKEWLAREERMEAIRRDSESTAAIVRHYAENGGSPAEAGLMAGAEIMSRAIAGLGPEMMAGLLADDPKALFGMVRELSRVADLLGKKAGLLASAAAAPDAAPAMTAEDRAAAMKQIFGLA